MKLGLLSIVLALGAQLAHASDGCYQTYRPGSMNVVICISGSNEEGIGGAGARVFLIGPNGGDVLFCKKTSKIEATATSRSFLFGKKDGAITLIPDLAAVHPEHGLIQFGRAELEYTKLDQKHHGFLFEKARESSLCEEVL